MSILKRKYEIIYADPAWSFRNKNTGGSMKSGASAHYPTMTVEEMCNLNIQSISNQNCILFMWWVPSQPKEAIKLAESWGFEVKVMTAFNWVKLSSKTAKLDFGMGFYTRGGSEPCLIGTKGDKSVEIEIEGSEPCLIATKGKIKRISASVRSVVMAKKEKHSAKPNVFREEIVKLMGDVPRIELFARKKVKGWDAWGNEVKKSIHIPFIV